MFTTVYRYKDIMDAPAMRRINGEKAIKAGEHNAIAIMADGVAWYFRKDKHSMWEMVNFTYCQTF